MQTPTLPSIEELRRRMQALATLDAILSDDRESRYYSFNAEWSEGEMMGSMRDGSGDEWFCLFREEGAIILGLGHERAMYRYEDPWPGLYEGVPEPLIPATKEPAFNTKDKSFCIWRLVTDVDWRRGPIEAAAGDDPDGSFELLAILDGKPETYVEFASEYYEVDVPIEAVAQVYAYTPLTKDLVARIAADRSFVRRLGRGCERDRLPATLSHNSAGLGHRVSRCD